MEDLTIQNQEEDKNVLIKAYFLCLGSNKAPVIVTNSFDDFTKKFDMEVEKLNLMPAFPAERREDFLKKTHELNPENHDCVSTVWRGFSMVAGVTHMTIGKSELMAQMYQKQVQVIDGVEGEHSEKEEEED